MAKIVLGGANLLKVVLFRCLLECLQTARFAEMYLKTRCAERVRVNDCIMEHRFGVRGYCFGTCFVVDLLGNYCWVGFSLYSRVARKQRLKGRCRQ